MSMRITNGTTFPLTVQLCQVGVLYHGFLMPGDTFFRRTGAVHFTIKGRINLTNKDDTRVFKEGVVPVMGAGAAAAGAVVGGLAGIALAAAGTGMAVSGLDYESFSSAGWYAGYMHELTIVEGGYTNFYIKDNKSGKRYKA